MDAANNLLVDDRWENAAMAQIVDRALAPFRTDDGRRIQVDGPNVSVPPRIAVGLALAFHELGTNAAKYGALSTTTGHIEVRWRIVGGKPDELHVSWEEIGGPRVTPPTRTGFGSKLIQRVLASEINGTAAIEYRPTGVVFTAVAPMPANADEVVN